TPVSVTCAIGSDNWTIAVHNNGDPGSAELLLMLSESITRGLGANASGRSVGLGSIRRPRDRAYPRQRCVGIVAVAGTTFTAHFLRQHPA
ncbi:MAG: hypothetical protein ABIX12_14565, partial [Rubrivivax sp.]